MTDPNDAPASEPADPFAPTEPPRAVMHADAPCEYGHCLKAWTLVAWGRRVCDQHAETMSTERG